MKYLFVIFYISFSCFGYSQDIPDYFEINKNYYRIKDSTDIEILQYNLKSAEIILKYFGEPNLKFIRDTSIRVIFFNQDIDNPLIMPFITRLWSKNGNYYKRDISFKLNFTNGFFNVDTVLGDSTYQISKKLFSSYLQMFPDDIFKKKSFDNRLWFFLNTIYEYADERGYKCLYFNHNDIRKYDKNLLKIFNKSGMHLTTKEHKKPNFMQIISISLSLILGSLGALLL